MKVEKNNKAIQAWWCFFTPFFFPVPHCAFKLQRSEMRLGWPTAEVNPQGRKSLVCVQIQEDVNAFSKSLLPGGKLIYTLTGGRASFQGISFPHCRHQSREQSCRMALCWPMGRQLSVWAGQGLQGQSFCLLSLLSNFSGNSMDNQGLNPAKCWHSSNAQLCCCSGWQCMRS